MQALKRIDQEQGYSDREGAEKSRAENSAEVSLLWMGYQSRGPLRDQQKAVGWAGRAGGGNCGKRRSRGVKEDRHILPVFTFCQVLTPFGGLLP